MPLPLVIGIAAGIAGVAGMGSGIHGASKLKEAKQTAEAAKEKHEKNIAKFERKNNQTTRQMDILGELELDILNSFSDFSDTIERIQNRPQFKEYNIEGVKLPKYDREELTRVSVGAAALLGGLSGAAAGTGGGFAAAGATTMAVQTIGSASTGAAISGLAGAAKTNATLALLGGGAVKAGGGGMALGQAVLGGASLGVGLLVGGIIFNIAGCKMSDKADEAYREMKKAEKTINQICRYLDDLKNTAIKYNDTLESVKEKYNEMFQIVSDTVSAGKTDWNDFSEEEKTATMNSVLLVGLLYKMCKINLVNKSEDENGLNTVNHDGVDLAIEDSETVLEEVAD